MTAIGSVQALLPTATQVGNPAINIAIFAAFVVVTLGIVIWASRSNTSAADFYAGGRAFTRCGAGVMKDGADRG